MFQRHVMNQCTALIRTQLTLTTLTFAEIAFWEIIFADGKIIINLYGLIFAIGRYVIVVSSMIIVGEIFLQNYRRCTNWISIIRPHLQVLKSRIFLYQAKKISIKISREFILADRRIRQIPRRQIFADLPKTR